MSQFVISAPPQASVSVAGSDARFPVRRVFCVGRNYAAHAREMGSNPDREPPFFFMKPADAVVPAEGTLPYPPLTSELHHEIELVVAIGAEGENVDAGDALSLVWGYGVGVDLTRRDLQQQAKDTRRPWDWGKAFDASAPCGPLHAVADVGHPNEGRVWLDVNGENRQTGDLNELIWSVPDLIAEISRSVKLAAGDLIFTGTPAGVGPLEPGDKVSAGVAGVGEIAFTVGQKPAA
ncbi:MULTISPECIES: fumarylacetoacetate hydrolase family protein [Pandoraea]|uniref:fumarylacetoacetate hydrolase family protein n=1 Tax=Pandoraea TaxID=93217 RepID=UPI001F5C1A71|nr:MULTISPECIES: fumarylacetoacetate hydrolase family protein [Pandoraea]MCI3206666.1 fumarylacetoacetate hydrolase [Pandoraea sp. LA3]MDN4584694.1 fumarylacetoacetate hydrolase [Pandoraea capi]